MNDIQENIADENIEILKKNLPKKVKIDSQKKEVLLIELSHKYDFLYKKSYFDFKIFFKIFSWSIISLSLIYFFWLHYLQDFEILNNPNKNEIHYNNSSDLSISSSSTFWRSKIYSIYWEIEWKNNLNIELYITIILLSIILGLIFSYKKKKI